jgi:hypothetical protein
MRDRNSNSSSKLFDHQISTSHDVPYELNTISLRLVSEGKSSLLVVYKNCFWVNDEVIMCGFCFCSRMTLNF